MCVSVWTGRQHCRIQLKLNARMVDKRRKEDRKKKFSETTETTQDLNSLIFACIHFEMT